MSQRQDKALLVAVIVCSRLTDSTAKADAILKLIIVRIQLCDAINRIKTMKCEGARKGETKILSDKVSSTLSFARHCFVSKKHLKFILSAETLFRFNIFVQ